MKLNKEEVARREGMAYALKIAREKGVEGLEEEIRFRNCTQLPLGAKRKNCEVAIEAIKNQTCDTFIALTCHTLNDEFGFGQKRLQKFIDRFEGKAECLADGYCCWNDIVKTTWDELGLNLKIRLFGGEEIKGKEDEKNECGTKM